MIFRRFLSTTVKRSNDPIQALYVSKIKEYSKLAAAGKIDQAEVNAEIEAAKARLVEWGFRILEFFEFVQKWSFLQF